MTYYPRATESLPGLFASCEVSTATALSVFVKATCEVVIAPLRDGTRTASGRACSAPDNSVGIVTAFYTSPTTIMSKLNSG